MLLLPHSKTHLLSAYIKGGYLTWIYIFILVLSSLFLKQNTMYYLSLLAYHVFFNSAKYLYFLLLLVFALLYIFMFPKDMGNMQEWAVLDSGDDGKKSFRQYLLHSPETSTCLDSNQSYFKVSTVSTFYHLS